MSKGKVKNFEVRFEGVCVVYVPNATDEQEAIDWATIEMDHGDFDVMESEAKAVDGERAESSKRHANVVVKP